MIDFTAKHMGFVAASYAITVVVLGVLVVWIILRNRTVAKRLDQLDAQGAQRRPKSDAAGS